MRGPSSYLALQFSLVIDLVAHVFIVELEDEINQKVPTIIDFEWQLASPQMYIDLHYMLLISKENIFIGVAK